jgi:arginyl-tRNA synthetase
LPLTQPLSEKEISLIQLLSAFAGTVEDAGNNYSPAIISNYSYELAKEYNQFYHDYPILKEENEGLRSFRLELSRNSAKILYSAMHLLGIEMPERM